MYNKLYFDKGDQIIYFNSMYWIMQHNGNY